MSDLVNESVPEIVWGGCATGNCGEQKHDTVFHGGGEVRRGEVGISKKSGGAFRSEAAAKFRNLAGLTLI